MKAAIMLLMINGNYTVDVTPIYFSTMAECMREAPLIEKQVRDTRGIPVNLTITCYEQPEETKE